MLDKSNLNIFLAFFIICGFSCSETKSKANEIPRSNRIESSLDLEEEVVEITLRYYGMMCTCPQWATIQNIEKYESSLELGDEIRMDSLFVRIEPKNNEVINPFDLDYDQQNPEFKFTGSFYKDKQDLITEDGTIFKCRVFKYSECSLL